MICAASPISSSPTAADNKADMHTKPIHGSLDLCYDNDPELLPVSEALRRITAHTPRLEDHEVVPLQCALNRILAEDILAPLNVPGHTNSAVDGYAMAGNELPTTGEKQLKVIAKAFAGKPFTGDVEAGECVRIMTGGVMPRSTDTVVMQEHVQRLDVNAEQYICIAAGHRVGQNVRTAGEDLRAGAVALEHGIRLLPAELGLLASMGQARVCVVRKPKVAFFSTGDEVQSLGNQLAQGEVYDSNRYSLNAMLDRMNVDIIDMGVIRDQPEAIKDAFVQASAKADVVLTTGGVSAGEADYVKHTLEQLGQVGFWKIAIRPGRPLAFGRLGTSVFFGLPGNPVAVMVTFYQFVQGALAFMAGERDPRPMPLLEAPCPEPLRKKPGRTEYYRAILSRNAQGELQVRPTGKTGSGLLHTMSNANCFIILDENSTSLEAGAIVKVQPFFALV